MTESENQTIDAGVLSNGRYGELVEKITSFTGGEWLEFINCASILLSRPIC